MDEPTGREALKQAAGSGIFAALTPGPVLLAATQQEINTDRRSVLGAGMTEGEADCRRRIAEAAGVFLDLPERDPMNKEVEPR